MSVYFTSDLHLGHKLAAEKRGFPSINEHDRVVVESVAKVANKRTVVYVLGDVAMDIQSIKLLDRIPGRKHLVLGNHDMFQSSVYNRYFERVFGMLKYKGLWLTHCPIHQQEMYRCMANVHGHIHKDTSSSLLGEPYINVNWDYWRRPLSLEEIRGMVSMYRHGAEAEITGY